MTVHVHGLASGSDGSRMWPGVCLLGTAGGQKHPELAFPITKGAMVPAMVTLT